MTENDTDLSPLALSILELLDERPMHPYELAATMRERHQDEFIRLNFGSLYHTVDLLEREGWIVPAEREKEGRRPERTIYRLTDDGRQVFVRVLADTLSRPRREYPYFSAGLMFMHHLNSADAARQLGTRAQALKATTDKLNAIMAELRGRGVSRLSLVELEHKIAMLDAERKWSTSMQKQIADGTLEWRVGSDVHAEPLRRGHGPRAH